MSKIRVLIVDELTILRAGLQMLVNAQPDMEVVGQADGGPEALRLAQGLRPDVVITELSWCGLSAYPFVEKFHTECKAKVLALTTHDDPTHLRSAFAAGASGYVIKTAAVTEFLSAIRAVHQDRVFVDLKLSDKEIQSVLGARGSTPTRENSSTGSLSQREREVLELLAQGHTNQQVADQLFLSVKTVETYRARIAEKLGLRSRADFTRYAIEMGLLSATKTSSEQTS